MKLLLADVTPSLLSKTIGHDHTRRYFNLGMAKVKDILGRLGCPRVQGPYRSMSESDKECEHGIIVEDLCEG